MCERLFTGDFEFGYLCLQAPDMVFRRLVLLGLVYLCLNGFDLFLDRRHDIPSIRFGSANALEGCRLICTDVKNRDLSVSDGVKHDGAVAQAWVSTWS